MRKFLVRNFVFNYIFIIFGKQVSYGRAANLMYVSFLFMCAEGLWKHFLTIGLFLYIIVSVILFVYFKRIPVKFKELTLYQRYFFLQGSTLYSTSNSEPISDKDVEEVEDYIESLATKRFYNLHLLVIKIIILSLCIFLVLNYE